MELTQHVRSPLFDDRRYRSLIFVCFSLIGCWGTLLCLSPDQAVAKDDAGKSAAQEDRVLRHAVFFRFKDSSTAEDLQSVIDAFAALPSKIDTITDFKWGTNNSPEAVSGGFTHCFLLTFKDEAGREVYLPHKAHKAFGEVLSPHMTDVFVIDYWGTAQKVELDQELKHAVFLKFKPNAPEKDVQAVERAFASLPSKIRAIKAFEWGTNNSPEKYSDGFTHCFMMTFDSQEGRAICLSHRDYKQLGTLLLPVMEDVRVLDFLDQAK